MAGTKTAKNKQPTSDYWDDGADALPRADIEIPSKMSKRRKFLKFYTWTAVVMLPMVLVSNVVLISEVITGEDVEPAAVSSVDSPTKAEAMLKVRNWLAADPSPLPGGMLLSWDGATTQQEHEIIENENGDKTEKQGLELHKLTVTPPGGALFTSTVQVAYSPIRGAQIMGEPTLLPKAPDDTGSWPNAVTWPNLVGTGASEQAVQAVNAWVKAFTSGDPDSLRLTVGDTQAGRSYVPLVQAMASGVTVTDSAAFRNADGSTNPNPSQVIARVTFGVTWEGQTVKDGAALSQLTYDVLIDKADTAAPAVVAWGGAGSGESLTPYMNAMDGRIITSDGIGDVVKNDPEAVTAEAGEQ